MYHKDGVLFLRNFIDHSLAQHLSHYLWPHGWAFLFQEYNSKSWLYNGVVRALLRDIDFEKVISPLFANISLGGKMYAVEAPLWGKNQRRLVGGLHADTWHADASPQEIFDSVELHSMWLAMTDAPYALEFMRGSHLKSIDIHRNCKSTGKLGNEDEDVGRILNITCLESYAADLTRSLGYNSTWHLSFQPGDAVLFNGSVLHRGWVNIERRMAVCIRFMWISGNSHIFPLNEMMVMSPRTELTRKRNNDLPWIPDFWHGQSGVRVPNSVVRLVR